MKAAAVILKKEDGMILLLKRSSKARSDKGKWENIGGSLLENESFEDAAKREALEGLDLDLLKLTLLYENKSSTSDSGQFQVQVFESTISTLPVIKDRDAIEEIKWFTLDELKDLDLAPYTREDFIHLGWIPK